MIMGRLLLFKLDEIRIVPLTINIFFNKINDYADEWTSGSSNDNGI